MKIASITDGTSNTGLISERLMGIAGAYPATVAAAGSNATRCSIHSPTGAAQGSGPAGALAMYQACANAPGTRGIRFCGNGELWAGGFPDYLVWQSYNHFGTPNQINCTNTSDPTDHNAYLGGLLRHRDRQRPAQQPAPGRRERGLRRRLGPLHQEHRRAEYLVGPRQPQPR